MGEDWPASEEDVKQRWWELTDQHLWVGEEIPVDTTSYSHPNQRSRGGKNTRWVDVVVIENLTEQRFQRANRYALQNGLTVVSSNDDETINAIPTDPQFFTAIVKSWPAPELSVRLIEIKQRLEYDALGQLLSYREFFGDYHSTSHTSVEVDSCELVYATADPFVEAATHQFDFECTSLPPPEP